MSKPEPTVAWIKERLKVERIPQKDLAAALGLDPSNVTRLLRGERRLRQEEIPVVMDFFGKIGLPEATVPPRLAAAFALPGATMPYLARRSGLDERRLLELKHGRGRGATPGEAAALGAAFGIDGDLLLSPVPPTASDKDALRRGLKATAPLGVVAERVPLTGPQRRSIPVHGAPAAIRPGIYRDHLEVVEWRAPPDGLQDVTGAYGIYVGDDQHAPMLLRGDVAVVHPGRPPLPGQRVVMRFDDRTLTFGLLAESGHEQMVQVIPEHRYWRLEPGMRLQAIVAVLAL